MRTVYRVLAGLVAAGVVFQVAVIAYGFFELGSYVEEGGTFDKAALEGGGFSGAAGFSLHGLGGNIAVILALLFLISSFFAKIPGGVRWALIVFGLTVLQFALAVASFAVAALGFLHGINALFLFACAVMAGTRVKRAVSRQPDERVAVPVG